MKNLYTYSKEINGSGTIFIIKINTNHQIFKGHFPGRPVLPGVCQIQIVKDIIESEYPKYTSILSSNSIKFLRVIDPNEVGELKLSLNIDEVEDCGDYKIKAKAIIYDDDYKFLKMDIKMAESYNKTVND